MNKEEAIKIVRSHYPANKQMLNEALEFLIPELKESEDEKIRKEIIAIFKGQIAFTSEEDGKKYIEWLEKQGDKDKLIQELGEYKVKYTQEVLEQHINSMGNKDDERLRKTTIAFLKDFAEQGYENAVECIDWLEKQSKNKPIERKEFTSIPFGAFDSELIEQMFTIPDGYIATIEGNRIHIKRKYKTATEAIKEEKVDDSNKIDNDNYNASILKVGDYVVRRSCKNFHDNRNFAKIIEIDEHICKLDNGRWLYDYEIRLWSVVDAQDGDILVSSINQPFIYNGWYNDSTIGAYCGFNRISAFTIADNKYNWTENKNIRPATKEERKTLFDEMNLLGWIWNPETKELNRLDKNEENNN